MRQILFAYTKNHTKTSQDNKKNFNNMNKTIQQNASKSYSYRKDYTLSQMELLLGMQRGFIILKSTNIFFTISKNKG